MNMLVIKIFRKVFYSIYITSDYNFLVCGLKLYLQLKG